MELRGCPQCDATAEVISEGQATSTNGPVDIVRVVCVNRHWFLMTRDRLPVADRTSGAGRLPDGQASDAER